MRTITQSTAYDLMVFMTDSADHISGKTGLTLTITASKDGGAFASISPTVTERGSGWYNLALTDSDTDTLGDLAIHVTSTGADPTDMAVQIGDASGGGGATAQQVWEYSLSTTPADGTAAKYLRSSGPNIDVAGSGIVGYNGLSAKDTVKEFKKIREILEEIKENEEEDDKDESGDITITDLSEVLSAIASAKEEISSVKSVPESLLSRIDAAVASVYEKVDKKEREDDEKEFSEVLSKAELSIRMENLENSVAELSEKNMMLEKEKDDAIENAKSLEDKLNKLKSALE